MSVVKMKPPARPPSRTWLGFAISFAIWALAGNSGAQAQTSNAMVFPREAAGLPIIPLPDLIYQALPKSDQESFGWVRWRRFSVQFGGLAKVGSGSDYAASLCSGLALSGASPG